YYYSMIIVNGNPAISYYDGLPGDLKYIRANDASGNSWGSAVIVDATGDVGENTCMQIINGNPAIVYHDYTNKNLKYARANDASGAAWNTPITLDATGEVGETPYLQVVNGNPAVSYYDRTNGDLKYIRSSDISGTSWNTPVIVDASGNTGGYPAIQIVNNKPVIAYQDVGIGDVKFISATDISGTSWGTPVVLDSAQYTGISVSMIAGGGYMGIAYYSQDQLLPFFIPGRYGFISLPAHYFRSKQNGNWNDADSWESSPDNINWGKATLTPDYTANTITIRSGHTINVTANVTVDQLVLEPGSVLNTKSGIQLIIQ
ncbi:MAG TPA: hypothetical protein VK498_14500, partial [Ferruginibacter sp.]|nr:hypothetical protein [Ferruginibacter sp.]